MKQKIIFLDIFRLMLVVVVCFKWTRVQENKEKIVKSQMFKKIVGTLLEHK